VKTEEILREKARRTKHERFSRLSESSMDSDLLFEKSAEKALNIDLSKEALREMKDNLVSGIVENLLLETISVHLPEEAQVQIREHFGTVRSYINGERGFVSLKKKYPSLKLENIDEHEETIIDDIKENVEKMFERTLEKTERGKEYIFESIFKELSTRDIEKGLHLSEEVNEKNMYLTYCSFLTSNIVESVKECFYSDEMKDKFLENFTNIIKSV